MRKDQCKFCTSRRCHHRIVAPGINYDEISCRRHVGELYAEAAAKLNDVMRCHLESTGLVARGEPYPCKHIPNELVIEKQAEIEDAYSAEVKRITDEYEPLMAAAAADDNRDAVEFLRLVRQRNRLITEARKRRDARIAAINVPE